MPIELDRGSAADIPALAPLWVAVHHRHAEAMPADRNGGIVTRLLDAAGRRHDR